jgi:hypothetical protein
VQDTFYFTSLLAKRNLKISVFLAGVVYTGTGSSKKKAQIFNARNFGRKTDVRVLALVSLSTQMVSQVAYTF